jgi:hypothetical protein
LACCTAAQGNSTVQPSCCTVETKTHSDVTPGDLQ